MRRNVTFGGWGSGVTGAVKKATSGTAIATAAVAAASGAPRRTTGGRPTRAARPTTARAAQHDQTALRRASGCWSEAEAGRERDLGAVRRSGLGHENERGYGDQRESADRARLGPLPLAGQRRQTGCAEHEHRDDNDPDRDGP